MAVKLRLMRTGKKKQPTYRVVAADSRSPRDGRFIELIGRYDPRQEPSVVEIDNDKAVAWLEKGAQPTDPVRKLLQISGAWSTYTGDVHTAPAAGSADADAPPAAKPVSGHQQEIHVVGDHGEGAGAPAPTHEEAAAAAAAGDVTGAAGDAVAAAAEATTETAAADALEAAGDAVEALADKAESAAEDTAEDTTEDTAATDAEEAS